MMYKPSIGEKHGKTVGSGTGKPIFSSGATAANRCSRHVLSTGGAGCGSIHIVRTCFQLVGSLPLALGIAEVLELARRARGMLQGTLKDRLHASSCVLP